jgi:hypothetical protein
MPEPIDNPREPEENLDGALLVDRTKRFSPECLAALRSFRTSKPWRGTPIERQEKFSALNTALAAAYGLEPAPVLQVVAIGEVGPDQHGVSGYNVRTNTIIVAGRLSVSSYLWAFARARGLTKRDAFVWSLSLFARIFPRSFESCRFEGPLLVRDNNQNL